MPVEAVATELAPYLASFERALKGGPRGLIDLRQAAFERFTELGFPTTREEDWKFTNLNPLTRATFELGQSADPALIEKLPADGPRLVFVNGHFVSSVSTPGAMLGNLRDASGALVERHLARYADYRKHAFVALNTAFVGDGAWVHVPAKAVADRPLYLIYVSLPGARPSFSNPRNLVVIGAGAHASVVECYLGAREYFTNAVTEIVAGDGAVLDHYKVQRESDQAFHISSVQIGQGRDSVVTSRSFALGGALARTEIYATLEQGCECTLNGLYLLNGKRHVDTRTTIDHAKPHAVSHELYKGILDGQSSAVFNGKIIVRKDAQKTDAKQTNKNLVLSEDATINTKPQLEIFADDVRCTHGATVGQLDQESIFYLRSRGIGLETARRMLIEAFAREIIDGVKSAELRDYLGRFL
jgi:Fe-S cluster assembly protein SufD